MVSIVSIASMASKASMVSCLLPTDDLLCFVAGTEGRTVGTLHRASARRVRAGAVDIVLGLDDVLALGECVEIVIRHIVLRSQVVATIVAAELTDRLQAGRTLVLNSHEVVVTVSNNRDAHAHLVACQYWA